MYVLVQHHCTTKDVHVRPRCTGSTRVYSVTRGRDFYLTRGHSGLSQLFRPVLRAPNEVYA